MVSRRSAGIACSVLALCVLGASSLGNAADGSGQTAVTIYTSLPFDGADRQQTDDVVRGERLALEQADSVVGQCRITFRRLDDSTPFAGQWDPGRTAANARRAAQDPSAIAYIGEFNSAASAISIPITNTAGVIQVSPSNTALELTKSIGPAGHGAPGKYYPTGKRTYARVAPADHIQAGALAEWMKSVDVNRLFIVNDRYRWGRSIARATAAAARLNGIRVLADVGVSQRAMNYRALARRIWNSRADAFFFGGLTASNAVALYRDVFHASPRIKLFGSDGVAETSFTKRIPMGAQRRMHITVGTIDPADYPPEGQQFFGDFKARYGHDPEPYAIYGYEAMSLVLDAMSRAGAACGNRTAVVDEVFQTRDRRSVLGTYSIDRDGDITTSRFGRFVVRRGRLVYAGTIFVKRDSYGHPLDR